MLCVMKGRRTKGRSIIIIGRLSTKQQRPARPSSQGLKQSRNYALGRAMRSVTGKGLCGEGVCGHKGGSKESSHERDRTVSTRLALPSIMPTWYIHPYQTKKARPKNKSE